MTATHAEFQWSAEDEAFVDDAVAYVIPIIDDALKADANAVVLTEAKVSLTAYVPEATGTVDLAVIANDMIHVLDLKFGSSIVSACGNPQGRLYGLALDSTYGHLYGTSTFKFTIIQPRRDHYDTEELPIQTLRDWGRNVVMPAAQAAWAGNGPFVPGAHCASGFCRARHTCSARAHYALQVGKSAAYQSPTLLTDEQVATILHHADHIKKWCGDVQGYALDRAVRGEKQWPGFKLVESRAQRHYANDDIAAEKLASVGLSADEIYDKKIIAITRAEKKIGKAKFTALFDGLIAKPRGKLKLVPTEDTQPAAISSIDQDFL